MKKVVFKHFFYTALLPFLMPSTLSAGTMGTAAVASNGSWFVGADVGVVFPNITNSINVSNGSNFAAPANLDNYSTNINNQSMVDVLFGYRWQRHQQWFPAYALGLRYQHLFSQQITGSITQYSVPDFNNYTYRWNVYSNIISLYGKVDIAQYGRFMPYVNAGVGGAMNQTGGFRETARPGITPRISPAYTSNRNSQFAYDVGAGLDYLLNKRWVVSLGYDYQSWGKLTSGPGQSTWSATRLDLGRFSTNTVLAGITFLI